MRSSRYFPAKVRKIMSDFAVMIAIAIMTTIDFLMGINTPKLNVPREFRVSFGGKTLFAHENALQSFA